MIEKKDFGWDWFWPQKWMILMSISFFYEKSLSKVFSLNLPEMVDMNLKKNLILS
jgi:hypothetical protein